jgi:glycerol-3-phosphate acyltransferase PlsX
MANIKIAIDAMSGDHGLNSVIPAVIEAIQQFPKVDFILVGDQTQILTALNNFKSKKISIKHCSETIAMDEDPVVAMRNKKDSSIRVAINLVKENQADAVVSSGNTGALMAIARFVLKMIGEVKRPALMSTLPTKNKRGVKMLDLGANINCTPEQLLQFALMATAFCKVIEQIPNPSVGVLNIGEEKNKGNELVQKASELINANNKINYYGFVEGNHIFQEKVDIIVCNGFVGNIVLKASEGLAKMLMQTIKETFMQNLKNKLRALIAMPVLKEVSKAYDPDKYNGSCLLGLKGIVVKSHGSANAKAFNYAIKQAIIAVQQKLPEIVDNTLGES